MDDYDARLHAFEVLLDASSSATEPNVELNSLRRLCARGIPPSPSLLRPQSWSLLLGSQSPRKSEWRKENRTKRRDYEGLVDALSRKIEESSLNPRAAPSTSVQEQDELLLSIHEDVQSLAGRSPYLARSIRTSKSSALRPTQAHESVELDAYVDSTTDEEEEHSQGRQIQGKGKGREDQSGSKATAAVESRRPEPLNNRRSIFARIDLIVSQRARSRGPIASRSGAKTSHSPDVSTVNRGQEMPPLPDSASSKSSDKSPAIVLSPSETPPPVSQLSTNPNASSRTGLTIDPHLANNNHADSEQIKLLSPQELRTSQTEFEDISAKHRLRLERPDTHLEALTRLLYVFFSTDKQWTYTSDTVRIARVLYTVFASGGAVEGFVNQSSKKSSGPETAINHFSRHAETETFWALKALMHDMGPVIGISTDAEYMAETGQTDLQWALTSFRRRLKWADYTLHDSLYARRWVTAMLAEDLRIDYLLPIWDFILSEPQSAQNRIPKADILIDVCTAMVLLLKGSLLGSHAQQNERRPAQKTLWSEDYGEMLGGTLWYARAQALLDNYPVSRVGAAEILRVAWEIKQRQALASLGGSPVEEKSESAGIGSIFQSLRQHAPAIDYEKMRSQLNVNDQVLKQYTTQLQDSDAAAKAFKLTSNLTAAALSRWNTVSSKEASPQQTNPAPGWGVNLNKWLKTSTSPESSAPVDHLTAPNDKFTAVPPRLSSPSHSRRQSVAESDDSKVQAGGASLYRRDTNLPPSFISPRGSIVYPAGKYRPRHLREGSGKVSIESRLSALASSAIPDDVPPVPPPHTAATLHPSPRSPNVKPLLLSGSARPASPHRPTDSSSSVGSEVLSPPSSVRFGPRRISVGSSGGPSNPGQSDVSDKTTSESRGGLARGGVESTSARLRAVTGHARRSAKESSTQVPPPTRYSLADPGAGSRPNDEDPSRSASPASEVLEEDGVRKYRLTDGPATPSSEKPQPNLNRSDSGGSQHSLASSLGITRRQVVKKGKFSGRRKESEDMRSLRESRQSVELGLPSPLPEEGSFAAEQVAEEKRTDLNRRPTTQSRRSNRSSADRDSLAAKDGYGDLLESYASLGDF